jgi:hypothetical protein
MLSPLVFSVATIAVPAVLADVKPVPANLEDWDVLIALAVIADVALVCWNSEDCDVLMALAVMADVLEVN